MLAVDPSRRDPGLVRLHTPWIVELISDERFQGIVVPVPLAQAVEALAALLVLLSGLLGSLALVGSLDGFLGSGRDGRRRRVLGVQTGVARAHRQYGDAGEHQPGQDSGKHGSLLATRMGMRRESRVAGG